MSGIVLSYVYYLPIFPSPGDFSLVTPLSAHIDHPIMFGDQTSSAILSYCSAIKVSSGSECVGCGFQERWFSRPHRVFQTVPAG